MDTDIAISGAGIAGLTAALLLANAGKHITLIEPYPPCTLAQTIPTGRSLALTPHSIEILRQTGAWDAVAHFSEPITGFALIDATHPKNPPMRCDFAGTFGRNMPNAPLRAALWEAAGVHPYITLHQDRAVSWIVEDKGTSITLGSTHIIKSRLLIAADGRKSPLREHLGLPILSHSLGQSALTVRIAHETPHHGIATEIWRAHGLLALVPLPGFESAVVWMDTPQNLPQEGALRDSLQAASLNLLGEVTLKSPAEIWPLERLIAPRITAPRFALLAEAAHVIPPTGAQGLNLSLRDVARLVRLVAYADDPGAPRLLQTYALGRVPDVVSCVFGVSAMNALIRHESLVARKMRRTGLRFLSLCPQTLHKASTDMGLYWQNIWR